MRRIYPTWLYRMPSPAGALLTMGVLMLGMMLVAVTLAWAFPEQQAQPAPQPQQQQTEDRLDVNDIKAMLGERDTAIAVQNKTIERLLKENAEWKKKAEACAPEAK